MKFIFERGFCERCGSTGFKLINSLYAEPIGGLGVAHDVLEHFPNDGGKFEDEILAFGAAYHVRGNSYFMNNQHLSYLDNWKSALQDVFDYLIFNNLEFPTHLWKSVCIKTIEIKDDEVKSFLRRLGSAMVDYILDVDGDNQIEIETAQNSYEIAAFKSNISALLINGYVKAKRRYASLTLPEPDLAYAFTEIQNFVDKNLLDEDVTKIEISIIKNRKLNLKIKEYYVWD